MKNCRISVSDLLSKLLIILTLGFVYLKTIAPGLTWANNGADGGDFITAAATWGVAHPPGYPVYLLIAKLFQLLPIGTIAFRTNLLSAACTVLASIILFDIAIRSVPSFKYKWLTGFVVALTFGISKMVWSQAVITEIYALQEVLFLSIIYFLQAELSKTDINPKVNDSLIGILFGLAIQNHLTIIVLLPPILLIGIVKYHPLNGEIKARDINNFWKLNYSVNWNRLIRRCCWIIIGSLSYLSLFLRAQSGSPDNWGNPSTIKSFLWVISAKIYSNYLFNIPHGFLLTRINIWKSLFVEQIGIIGLIIAVFGLISMWKKSNQLALLASWIVLFFILFSFIYNSSDSYIYLIFAMISISLWFGWGVNILIIILSQYNRWYGLVISLMFIGYLIFQGFQTYPLVDVSHDYQAEQFGEKVMTKALSNAIVFTDGDKDSFSLWYFHYVLDERPDICIVVTNLLPYAWYRNTLEVTYPNIKIPVGEPNESWKEAIMALNPNRPQCNTIVIEEASFTCSDKKY